MTRETISALRRSLAEIERAKQLTPDADSDARLPKNVDRIAIDRGTIDAAIGGGLLRPALHEIVAVRQADAAAACGFAMGLGQRTLAQSLRARTLLWAEHETTRLEIGALSGDGLNAFGLDPSALLYVKARDPLAVLRAAFEAAKCPAFSAVVGTVWAAPKVLDLNATRRLMLAARHSGVMIVLLRLCTSPQPSAAETRWIVEALPSQPFAANAPGRPAFRLTLMRHRHGTPAGPWLVEWNADDTLFHTQDIAAANAASRSASLPGNRSAASGDGPVAPRATRRILRLAG